jgi:uncharacterized membrane protein HdeD (DUF308 family)
LGGQPDGDDTGDIVLGLPAAAGVWLRSAMRQPDEMLGRLGRHWGWVLFYGIITVAAGIAAIAWPGETLLVVAVLFGIQLIFSGVFRLVGSLSMGEMVGAGTRVLYALLGILSIIIGLWAIRHVVLTLLALVVFLGIYWIVSGVIDIFSAISERGMPNRGWTSVLGVLSILAGLIVLAVPGLSLFSLAVILGIWLLIFGFSEVMAAFRIRRATH